MVKTAVARIETMIAVTMTASVTPNATYLTGVHEYRPLLDGESARYTQSMKQPRACV